MAIPSDNLKTNYLRMNNFKELKVWQRAIELVILIYKITQTFPKEEVYGLTSQIRRAASSIPSNIAEGAGRMSPEDFIHFLNIARGSSFELETQLIIAHELNYVNQPDFESLTQKLDEIQKMISGLQRSINNK